MTIQNLFRTIFRKKPHDRQLHVAREEIWDLDDVREMTTDEIVKRLRSFGIPLKKRTFLRDVKRFHSAEELSESWRDTYDCAATGFDEDFPWMAACVLWERLAPDRANMEMINDLMQEGYDALEKGRTVEACNLWLRTWDCIKEMLTEEMTKVEHFDDIFKGTQYAYNWCQDLEMELGNAGIKDREYSRRQMKYCAEFCSQFPDEEELVLANMRRGEADAYFYLGDTTEGEKKYQELTERYPDYVWGYIGWADHYWDFYDFETHTTKDYDRAEELYLKALKIADSEERKAVLGRLIDLYKGTGDSKRVNEYMGKLEELEAQPRFEFDSLDTSSPESKRTKVGRNEPCPCGSGKKYKRCCGR